MDFEVMGVTYRCSKLSANEQWHIVRRLLPVISQIAPVAGKSEAGAEALPLIADALARLSNSDDEYVRFGLLSCVKRKQEQGLGWAAVSTGHQLMFEDIDMAIMLQLCAKAFMHNLSGFFAALPSDLQGAIQKQSVQSAG